MSIMSSEPVTAPGAVLARRELWVAVGPPSQHAYQRHTFSA